MARHEALDALLEAAMAKTANREMMYILVPEHQPALRSRLESLGFEPGEEYAVFSRRTVRPVKAPRRVLPALVTPAMR
ncbi:MAG: hypothetical protein HYX50_05230 [Chloroflexi bacterium]|nr:hypothetical protein [Chloroflexota bacterium]